MGAPFSSGRLPADDEVKNRRHAVILLYKHISIRRHCKIMTSRHNVLGNARSKKAEGSRYANKFKKIIS